MISEELKKTLRAKLEEEKKKLEEELRQFAKATGTPGNFETQFDNIGEDEDENAKEVETYADNLALEKTLEERLKEVADALERMEQGTYGICENCNEEIDEERLKVYPAARVCIKCKK